MSTNAIYSKAEPKLHITSQKLTTTSTAQSIQRLKYSNYLYLNQLKIKFLIRGHRASKRKTALSAVKADLQLMPQKEKELHSAMEAQVGTLPNVIFCPLDL